MKKSTKTAKSFADYKSEGHNWITLATGEYYPDILKDACELYKPVLVMFGQLLRASESSTRLFMAISETPDGWMRIQLARVFRKYASPEIPVEMLKKKTTGSPVKNVTPKITLARLTARFPTSFFSILRLTHTCGIGLLRVGLQKG